MRNYGAEMLLSSAMFWASRAERHPEHHEYEIKNVIGPDEWHEYVNNNAYTNYMARLNIQDALAVLQWLRLTAPDKANELIHKLHVTTESLEQWHDVAEHLCVPQDQGTGVFEQFDGFFQLEPLDQDQYNGRSASYQAILGLEP